MAINNITTPSDQVFPHWLFGIYILEIGKFFNDRFKAFKVNANQTNTSKIQVSYGTPRAAFRYMLETNNGKMALPLLSFFMFDYSRIAAMNRPMWIFNEETVDQEKGTIVGMRAPSHFSLNINFNLYTNNNRERDYIMTELFQCMPLGDMWLHSYPDIENHPDVVLAVPLKIDENITDETTIEGLDVKDTRDVVRTVFNMQCTNAMVPMKMHTFPAVKKIQSIVTMCAEKSNNEDEFSFMLTKNLLHGKIIQS